MIECVRILQESVLFVRDGQLDFAENVAILDIDENVISALLEPVGHTHQWHILVLIALPHQLIVDLHYFLLLRGDLAAHQVHHLKSYHT